MDDMLKEIGDMTDAEVQDKVLNLQLLWSQLSQS